MGDLIGWVCTLSCVLTCLAVILIGIRAVIAVCTQRPNYEDRQDE